ncbi:transglycosylase SLT domain-containing protein [Aromatoleum evansii]|uniref:Transglycosylase SLT domain-containing protein n=1 Tax=Aromatoleum evansii TaxID=59406 RepID=A0ABZ1AU69_AROEV|nr:transglycosylase SLT domain-containing protein [Aromatoleum evansii]
MKARLAFVLFLLASLVWAGVTYTDFLKALGQRESTMNPRVANQFGHVGLFQFSEAALQDVGLYSGDGTPKTNDWTGTFTGKYGVNSLADLLANSDAQIQAVSAYHQQVWNTLTKVYGAENYLGTTINDTPITASGLVAAAHLVGAGTVGEWLKSGGATDPADGNGTKLVSYLGQFVGYTLAFAPPSYAEVLAGAPAGVSPGGHVPTSAPLRPSAGTGSAALLKGGGFGYTSAAQGFFGATGYHMGQVRQLLVGIAAMTLVTWIAWVIVAKWRGLSEGFDTKRELAVDVARAIVLTWIVLLIMM